MQFVTLPFDNLTYNLYVKSDEDIEFILPHLVPNKKPKLSKTSNTFLPSEEIVIKVAIVTEDLTPKLSFIGDDEECNITESGSLELMPNSVLIVEFTTSNGGLNWLVHSCNGASNTAEGAETIAKNALKVARRANNRSKNTLVIAEDAKETAESTIATADEAKSKAEEASTNATQAVNDSTIAKRRATRALNEAQAATTVANEAKTVADEAKTTAEEALAKSGETQQKVTELEELVDVSLDKADNAVDLANAAQTTATEAKTTSEFALKTALDAKSVATELKDNVIYKTSATTQRVNSNITFGKGYKLLLDRSSGSNINGIALNQYDELTDKFTNVGLEQVEVGSTTTMICLNHTGTTYTDAEGVEHTVDGHIRVDYRDTPESPVKQDQLAYMSDLAGLQEQIDETNNNKYLKLNSDTNQDLNSSVTIMNGKQLLMQRAKGSSYVGLYSAQYDELHDINTNMGLEQLEIGSTTMLMCLNHCGASYTKADGTTDKVDHHIRVDYREDINSPVVQDQLAYLSDVSAINTDISNFKKNYEETIGTINTNYENLKDYAETNITKLSTDLDTLTTTVENNNNYAQENIQSLKESVNTLNQTVADNYQEYQDKVALIDSNITNLTNTVTTNNTNVNSRIDWVYNDYTTKFNTLNDAVIDFDDRFTTVDESINNLNTSVTANATAITELGQRVDAKDTELDQKIDNSVKDLNQKIEDKTSEINNKIDTDIGSLSTKVDGYVDTLNIRIDTEVKTINDRIDTEVDTVNNKIDTDVSNLKEEIDTEISGVKDNIATIEANHTALEEKVDNNYSALRTGIQNNYDNINNLNQELDDLSSNVVKRVSDTTQSIDSNLSMVKGKKFLLNTLNTGNVVGMFVGSYDGLTYEDNRTYEQLEIGSTSIPMCLNHTGYTVDYNNGAIETNDGHIRVDYRKTPDSEVIHDQLAYLSDISRIDEELANRIKINSDTTQDLLTDLAFETGHKLLLKKYDGGVYTGISSAVYNNLIDTATSEPLEMMEMGSPSVPMHLNHCGVRFITPTGTEEEIDYHIPVDYRKSLDSPVVMDQLAYMSDIREVNLRIDDLDIGGADLKNVVKLTHEGYQTLDTGLILKNGRKFLLENHSGSTVLGFYFGYYDELKDKNTGAGLEQIEMGTPTAIMCLNHCGTTYTDAEGTEHTIDGHIRVGYRETPTSEIVQDQLAYMSDISKLQELIDNLTEQLNNLEIKVGKI